MTNVLDADQVARSLRRIAHEIVEQTTPDDDVVLLGIPRRGVVIADRLGDLLADLGRAVPIGTLDPQHHRDDLDQGTNPAPDRTDVPFSIHDRTVVLVDDVLSTGRTIRAALDALVALGRPGRVQVAVLVDRGHRELPIRADYVGKNVPTAYDERVTVKLRERDDVDGAWIETASEVPA